MEAVEDRCHAEIAAAAAADAPSAAKGEPKYGVLSAPVGSGKTFCVVAMCLRDRHGPPKEVRAAKRGTPEIAAHFCVCTVHKGRSTPCM